MIGPDPNFQVLNEDIEIKLKEIGHMIGDNLPPGWGFNLLIFDFNKEGGGSTFYISNGRREDSLKLMQEFIDKQTGKEKS